MPSKILSLAIIGASLFSLSDASWFGTNFGANPWADEIKQQMEELQQQVEEIRNDIHHAIEDLLDRNFSLPHFDCNGSKLHFGQNGFDITFPIPCDPDHGEGTDPGEPPVIPPDPVNN